MSSALFSSFAMRGLSLPNRIVISPMGQYSAQEGGFASQWHLVHLGHLSTSGMWAPIVEAAGVRLDWRGYPLPRRKLGLRFSRNAAFASLHSSV